MFSIDALAVPIMAAPMAGGPSTPELVVAAAEVGGTGFLAAGYKTAAGIGEEIGRVRAATLAAFGVNLFVPSGLAAQDVDRARDVEAYRRALQSEADRYKCTIPQPDAADRDGWEEKIALLLEDPVPIVSFTFGCPDRITIELLQRAGSYVVVSVTDAAEAVLSADHGADALCVQGPQAGGHRVTHHGARARSNRIGDPPEERPRCLRSTFDRSRRYHQRGTHCCRNGGRGEGGPGRHGSAAIAGIQGVDAA